MKLQDREKRYFMENARHLCAGATQRQRGITYFFLRVRVSTDLLLQAAEFKLPYFITRHGALYKNQMARTT